MPRLPRTHKSSRSAMDYRPATINMAPKDDELLDRTAEEMGLTRSAVMRLALRSFALDGMPSAPSRKASAQRSASDENDEQ